MNCRMGRGEDNDLIDHKPIKYPESSLFGKWIKLGEEEGGQEQVILGKTVK